MRRDLKAFGTRNSDNTQLRQVLQWEPQISLEEGLKRTYLWIDQQVRDLAPQFSLGIAHLPVRS